MRILLLSIAVALGCSTHAAAQLDEILKKAGDTLAHGNTADLSNDKIIAGLKQALQVSTGKAVALTGRPDGFLKNQAIRILLPQTRDPWPRHANAGNGSESRRT